MSYKRVKSLKNDIEYGLNAEKDVIKKLCDYFDEVILKNTFQYSIYDAKCKQTQTNYEIKSRRNCKKKYPTTIVSYNKIMKKQENEKLIFVFQFTDGLYFIEYNPKLFSTFEIQDIIYYREGVSPKPVKHICIPVNLLLEIEI